ncbi:hypothetical protein [Tabrizicola sp.]|uniref:hypothetical protein n=1 Tax=Tabrizicola sp. TaxID=2005166 RepID=UPI001A62E5E1|nr:hypothetical protein [Tabrizicola sp.]MBL9062830.1 hypothetical protein [Tabrizicola sp.]
MSETVEVPAKVANYNFARALRGAAWTPEADADLRVMFENGSDISTIAEEMDRTEREVLDQIRGVGPSEIGSKIGRTAETQGAHQEHIRST